MKTRVILYGENDKPISILGDNPQEKVKKVWDAVIALLAIHTDDIMRVESVEVWDSEADTPQTEALKRMRTFSEGGIGYPPQTENKAGCSRCAYAWDCSDKDMPHAMYCNNYGKRQKGAKDDIRRI